MSDHHDTSQPPGFSRRGFLRGIGVTGAAASVITTLKPEASAAEAGIRGPGEVPVTLKVNGTAHKLNLEPRVTLLDALRNRLDLTGCKKVCDRATCGSCTCLVDGEPVYSCTMLAIEAEGRSITTVEGIGTTKRMSAVQAAFVKNDAQQCGFCTPGFVTAATAFVRKNPNATIDEIRAGLGGNLCRCGTYAGMLLAVSDATKKGGA